MVNLSLIAQAFKQIEFSIIIQCEQKRVFISILWFLRDIISIIINIVRRCPWYIGVTSKYFSFIRFYKCNSSTFIITILMEVNWFESLLWSSENKFQSFYLTLKRKVKDLFDERIIINYLNRYKLIWMCF